jgi:hypothetical protein
VAVGGSKCAVDGAGGKEGIKEGRVLNVDGGKQVQKLSVKVPKAYAFCEGVRTGAPS